MSQTTERATGAPATATSSPAEPIGRSHRDEETFALEGEAPPRYAKGKEIIALAITGGIVGILLLTTLIAVFPAATAATEPNADSVRVPLLFGITGFEASPDTALLLLVVFASAIGSFVHVATSFTHYAGRGRLEVSWLSWYALRCLIGAALATVFYFVLRAGFFSGDATNASVNAYGIAAVAGFVGLFSRQATDKLKELFDTLFKTDSADEELDPVITEVTPDPVVLDPENPVDLTVAGSGFVRMSQVRIAGKVLTPRLVGPGQLIVRLRPGDLKGREGVGVTVVNPGPCSTSNRYALRIVSQIAGPPNGKRDEAASRRDSTGPAG
jgi:hypothetical protein